MPRFEDIPRYEVVVGNIGRVYSGSDWHAAEKAYFEYVDQSQTTWMRASGEDVVIFQDGEIFREYEGRNRANAEDF